MQKLKPTAQVDQRGTPTNQVQQNHVPKNNGSSQIGGAMDRAAHQSVYWTKGSFSKRTGIKSTTLGWHTPHPNNGRMQRRFCWCSYIKIHISTTKWQSGRKDPPHRIRIKTHINLRTQL